MATDPDCSAQRTQCLLPPPSHPRQKIFKEKALPDIENYMFENHDQLRQAATECMCNMVVNKEVRAQDGDQSDRGLEGWVKVRAWHYTGAATMVLK